MSGPDLCGLKLNVVQYFIQLYFMFIKPVQNINIHNLAPD